jgi:hypothetical protein
MDGGDWIWMSFMMVSWLVALLALIYLVVRLAGRAADHHPKQGGSERRPDRERPRPPPMACRLSRH